MIEQLKQKMKSKGVTAYRLSKITGISRSTIGRIVKYECDPLLSTYSKLMDALGDGMTTLHEPDGVVFGGRNAVL